MLRSSSATTKTTTTNVWRWLAWILEHDMTTTTNTTSEVERLTLGDIDQALTHWANKLHTDPDPISRWQTLETCDMWLDCRLRHQRNTRH